MAICQGFACQKEHLKRSKVLCKASERPNVRGINFLEWSGKLIPQGPIVSGEFSDDNVGFGKLQLDATWLEGK